MVSTGVIPKKVWSNNLGSSLRKYPPLVNILPGTVLVWMEKPSRFSLFFSKSRYPDFFCSSKSHSFEVFEASPGHLHATERQNPSQNGFNTLNIEH